MVSEDSDQLVPGLLPVHGLNDLCDLDETVGRRMPAGRDELHAARELLEVLLLGAAHRVPPEERNDRSQKIVSSTHDVPQHVLAVVVVPPVRNDVSDAEELTKVFEARNT